MAEVVVGGGEGALAQEGGSSDPGVGSGECPTRALEVGAQDGIRVDFEWWVPGR